MCEQEGAILLRQWGIDTLSMIRADFHDPATGLYANELDVQGNRKGPAFLWGGGVHLSALVAAAQCHPKYRSWLEEYRVRLRLYWNDEEPVPGYDVLPCPKPRDRYYDDNVWLVLAYLEAYESLRDNRYLHLAEETMIFVLSGMDHLLGGGIYWKENNKESKHTCSNAPSALACYRLYHHTRDRKFRNTGNDLLAWLLDNLQDPSDLLMWDNIRVANGEIERTKWSYNTALTFHAMAMKANVSKSRRQQEYWLKQAHDMAQAALMRWWDPETGSFTNGLRFDHLLADALLFLDRVEERMEYTPKVIRALDFLHTNGPDDRGHYSGSWNSKTQGTLEKAELIDQASAARAYLSCANHLMQLQRTPE